MTVTSWVGTTDQATLDSNWTNHVPDSTAVDVDIGNTTSTSLVGFGAIRSRGTLTGTANFANAETVTLDSKVYTFVDPAAPSADGEVDLGGTLTASLDNLMAAINLETPIGGKYGGSMTLHPTVTALSSDATTLVVAAKDAVVGGDSIASTETGANASWGGATLTNFAATGATLNDIILKNFNGDLNSSGAMAIITFSKIHKDGGAGAIYVDVQNGNRIIVGGDNRALSASIKLTGNVANSIEVVGGHCAVNWNGLTGSIMLVWVDGPASSLTVTGTGTLPTLVVEAGTVVTNGPTVTNYNAHGGLITHTSGAITTLWTSAGYFQLDAAETVTLAHLIDGTLDTTQTVGIKTITKLWEGPAAKLTYRKDVDVIGNLRRIGAPGED